MNLILHIGTNKTGTTALQKFLSFNRGKLTKYGIHYATPPDSYNFNSVVRAPRCSTHDAPSWALLPRYHLVEKQDEIFGQFFLDHLNHAEREGFHTIVASSEALYCMPIHLYDPGDGKVCVDTLAQIECLRAAIPSSVNCRIVCYVRRPDRYLESLYNQCVKQGMFTGEIGVFAGIVEDMLDYHRCLSMWRKVFGDSNMEVRVYETALPNLVHDFLRYVLHLHECSLFAKAGLRVNKRLGRDLIEYIRLLNSNIPCSERTFDEKICTLVDDRIANPSGNHEYLSPDERAALLSRLKPSMERLRTDFALPAFPRFSLEAARASWQPYPGLSLEKRREIEFHYNAVQRQIGFRVERLLIRAASLTRRRLPFLSWLLDFARGSGIRRLVLEATSRFR
ncbi:hypothetical protein EN836_20695 [Mesorhizobium sp. M1C.F.Ca.ET.193.01.1.1]|uniref:hypothetical protein n=1 Tax=unclassified Mesorhizobium TaxID=325217 RepID=UPI000FD34D72|nr:MULTISPECIES: hypothetical protein [unclassified Mesorhizobium]TGQ52268.1 hypothetical protein EN853_20685 [Mesorhizobium sp. M1C.F.Ca.ET.210.01.1.1]TGR04258.1 hypothetical protein EN847_20690 [Mesorhizobium sp. M1C.F.Ca.ET.204.01.1.1]TGR24923.1 hypothetical protein EN839_20690 [Mesorhizobium sp. M1C.F.Ca.ET.196.01.1.1]TGR63345.1 hypothetical protein EN835_020680 [Mesorhizobium sp. M1C.F.Ca.ET.192.01.1.1]TGR77312.1 hypothetical protein EN832_20695 [Mesorhizobium sp. M1C.F.Ca.ET.189.01.1.1]